MKRLSLGLFVLAIVLASCTDSDSSSGGSEKSPADECYERCENNINTCRSNANQASFPADFFARDVESMCTSLYNCDEECRYYQR